MFKKNVIKIAVSTALLSLALSGCDASYAKEEQATPPDNDYESPEGNGTSSRFVTYQGKEVYLNGVNAAWFDFANDFGSESGLDENKTNQLLSQVKEVGGNTVRWWIHVNGNKSPIWNSGRTEIAAASEQVAIIDDIKRALDLAEAQGMYIMPTLWSFDMLAMTQGGMSEEVVAGNYSLLTEQSVRESYINNFLIPLLDKVAGHPALIAVELFNEPENMTESWFTDREGLNSNLIPSYEDIHATTALLSAAIHKKATALDKEVLVTTGPKSLGLLNAAGFGGENHYSDTNMVALGGEGAELDFYAPHYYDDQGKEGAWSPFYHKASYWNLDKPVIIGEFFADKDAEKPASFTYFDDPIAEEQLCVRLKENNYAGGISWQWNQYQASVLNCVKAVTSGDIPSENEQISYHFEGTDVPVGFDAASETGTAELSISDLQSKSDNALALNMTSAEGEKKGAVILPLSPHIIPEIATVNAWVYIPQETADSGFTGGKIFAKTGEWVWNSGEFINATPGEWTLFSWTPTEKLSDIKELGIEIYAGDGVAATNAVVYFDDITILSEVEEAPEIPEVPEVPSYTYDFESDSAVPSKLGTGSDSGGTATLSVVAGEGVEASNGLIYQIDEPAAAATKPNFIYNSDGTETISAISFMVKLSAEAAAGISGGKVYAKTGAGWDWSEGDWVSLSADTWTEVSFTPTTPWTEVQQLGISFYGDSGNAVNADIYIDNIQIDE